MARNPKCTVSFTRTRYGLQADLMYKGERLDSASVDPGEKDLVKWQLLKGCKERVAARIRPGFDAGRFFRVLDDMRARRSR